MEAKTKKTAKTKVGKFDYKSIKTFEDACKKLGIDPNQLPVVPLEELKQPTIAVYKLMIIYKAINDGWIPDWNNTNQYKYFAWFGILSSGFGFSYSDCGYGGSGSVVGSRLCTDSREKALYIASQFEAEYKEYFLYSENK